MAEILTGQCLSPMQRDYKTASSSQRDNYHLNAQYSFQAVEKWWTALVAMFDNFSCNDLLIHAFIKAHGNVMTFHQITFGLKMSHRQRERKARPMKVLREHFHRLIALPRGPRLHHRSLLPLATMRLCATQEGGVTARGHRGQAQWGNQSALSLCDSISRLCTHEWMPRHWSSEPRTESQTLVGWDEPWSFQKGASRKIRSFQKNEELPEKQK